MKLNKKFLIVMAIAAATAAVAAPLFKFDWLGSSKAAYVVLPGKEISNATFANFSADGKYFIAISRQLKLPDGFEDLFENSENSPSAVTLYCWTAQNNALVAIKGPTSWPAGSSAFWENKRAIAHFLTPSVGQNGESQYSAYRFDPAREQVTTESTEDAMRFLKEISDTKASPSVLGASSATPSLELKEGQVRVAMGNSSATVRAAWLSLPGATRKGSVFLGAEDGNIEMAPNQTAVAFTSHGSFWVRKIIRLSDSQRSSLYDAARKEAMDRAKQVGLGLLMYSGDADDLFPLGEGFPLNTAPYVRSQSLFDGFNYSPPSDLKNDGSATTAIGSVNGPDGVATIYADGHVGYTPDP